MLVRVWQIVEIPVSARDIEREHHSQLKRWRKNRGELNFKSPPRMHGARVIMLAEPPRRQDLQQNPTIIVEVPPPTPQTKKAAKTKEERSSIKKKKKSVKKSSQTAEIIPNPYPLLEESTPQNQLPTVQPLFLTETLPPQPLPPTQPEAQAEPQAEPQPEPELLSQTVPDTVQQQQQQTPTKEPPLAAKESPLQRSTHSLSSTEQDTYL